MVFRGRTKLQLLIVAVAELGVRIDNLLEILRIYIRIISSTPSVAVLDPVITGNIAEIEVSTYRLQSRQLFLVYVLIGSNLEPVGLLNLADEVGAYLVSIKCEIAAGIVICLNSASAS